MDALIFDFDGVLVDSEPVHLECYQQVLRDAGISLTREEYYARYLGYDDYDAFGLILHDRGMTLDDEQIEVLVAKKTTLVKQSFARLIRAQPGALKLVEAAEIAVIPTAVCSGGLLEEIDLALSSLKMREHFMAIVSADEVQHGKPDPEGYRAALAKLIQLSGRVLLASKTVAIEDAPAGIAAAHAAGMKVLAVTTSYDAAALADADRVAESLEDVTVADLEKLVR